MNTFEKARNKLVEDAMSGTVRVSPMKAIRAFCLECNGYSPSETKDCQGDTVDGCPLFKFRFGRNMTGRSKK